MLGKMGKLFVPLAAVGHAGMDHHEGLALTRDFVIDSGIVDRCEARAALGLCHYTPPQRAILPG
jgi:hypothetical protein